MLTKLLCKSKTTIYLRKYIHFLFLIRGTKVIYPELPDIPGAAKFVTLAWFCLSGNILISAIVFST